jgi:hemerythrin
MLIEKSRVAVVDMDFMNDLHSEDIEIINTLFDNIIRYEKDRSQENREAITREYKLWHKHTINHFKTEEDMMIQKQFPPYMMHKSEHDRALNIMQDEFDKWESSYDIDMLKRYIIEDVPLWLEQHISTMDTITASFFKSGTMMCHQS